MDGKVWIECTGCQKWNHTDCEIAQGQDKMMREVAMELNKQVENENKNPEVKKESESEEEKPYWCVKCRRSRAAEENKRNKAEMLKNSKAKIPQSQPTQERVSTRQLARVSARRKRSTEIDLDSFESELNPEDSSRSSVKQKASGQGKNLARSSPQQEKDKKEDVDNSSMRTRRKTYDKK